MSLTNIETVEAGLKRFCERNALPEISELRLLTGGANMELWAFASGSAEMVLRRYRNGKPHEGAEERLSMASEAEVIKLAEAANIKAPKIIGVLEQSDALGPGYVMSHISGESLPTRLFRDEKYSATLETLTAQLGTELAKIHATDIPPDLLETKRPSELLERITETYEKTGYESPVIAAAIHWLSNNLPGTSADTCFVHGDFRMGNVLVTEKGLSAVLDWELIHFGLPEEDLAWLCMPSWRFGRYEKTAGGVGSLEDLISAYESSCGRKIDRAVFDWFLVYSSLSWGATTVLMAHWWREGEDRSLERILVGTRISEVEIDLLLMLEDIAGISSQTNISTRAFEIPARTGDVQPAELTEAAIEYLSNQVVAESKGAAKFHARIAANALSIAQRMIESGPEFALRAKQRLDQIGVSNAALCKNLRAGKTDWRAPELLSHLRLSSLERLIVHQPKYAAFQVAQKKWRKSENV